MNKPLSFIAAAVCGVVIAGAAQAAQAPAASVPQGFNAPPAQITGPNAPGGFAGNLAPTSVESILANAYDKQYVMVKGSLVRYLGDDKYEFTDGKTSMIVELDDDRRWDHIRKDQLITIYGEVDRDWNYVKIEVDRAEPVAR